MIPQCPTGYIAFARGCGHHQAAAIRCKSILCVDCERERADRIQTRWLPTLEQLPKLRLLTLTIKNGPDLAERMKVFDRSFRRLLDFRCGRNTRNKIKRAVAQSVALAVTAGTLAQEKADNAIRATESWCRYLAKHEKTEGKSFKVRKLLRGLSSLEVTYNEVTGWHPHRHLIVSMRYLPFAVLHVLWTWATKGQGKVADIRSVTSVQDGLKEAIKYTVKPWAIPEGKHEELLQAMHRKKRLWVIGRIKPQPEDRQPCPGCESQDCTCQVVTTVSDAQAIIANVMYIAEISDGVGYKPMTITFARDTKGRFVWDTLPVRGEGDLSLYQPSVSSKQPVDDWATANHDPPSAKFS